MIVFFIIFLLGLVMVQFLSSFSRMEIIGTLTNTHLIPDDPAPCPETWTGSYVLYIGNDI